MCDARWHRKGETPHLEMTSSISNTASTPKEIMCIQITTHQADIMTTTLQRGKPVTKEVRKRRNQGVNGMTYFTVSSESGEG